MRSIVLGTFVKSSICRIINLHWNLYWPFPCNKRNAENTSMQKTPFHALKIERKRRVVHGTITQFSLIRSHYIPVPFNCCHSHSNTIQDGWSGKDLRSQALPFNANIMPIDRLSVRYEPLKSPNGFNLCRTLVFFWAAEKGGERKM